MSDSLRPQWTTACQASLSFTISWSLLELMSIESVMPSKHLILCHALLLLPYIFPSIRGFSNELALCIRWSNFWSFGYSISSSGEYSGLLFSDYSIQQPLLDFLLFWTFKDHHMNKDFLTKAVKNKFKKESHTHK